MCTLCAVKAGKVHGSTDVKVAGLACLLLLSGLVESLVALGVRAKVTQVRVDFSRTVAPCIRAAALEG